MSKKIKNNAEKFNIRPYLIIFGIVLAVLSVVALAYFFEDYHHVRKISYDTQTDTLYDKRYDVTYVRAPECYEAVRLSKHAYAKDRAKKDVKYYQLGYLDADGNEQLIPVHDMLTSSREHGSAIYYNPETVTMPPLSEFEANEIYACNYYNTLDTLSESETKVFIESYHKGSEASITSVEARFTLRVRSEKYPQLSYKLDLLWEDGVFYVQDLVSGKITRLPENAQRIFDKERLSLIAEGGSK